VDLRRDGQKRQDERESLRVLRHGAGLATRPTRMSDSAQQVRHMALATV